MEMSFSFNFTRTKSPTVVKFADLKSLGEKEHLVWSYCGIHRNGTAGQGKQPHVFVSFRKREGNGWSDDLLYKRIPKYLDKRKEPGANGVWKATEARSGFNLD